MTSANPLIRLARAVFWMLALVATLKLQEPKFCSCGVIKSAQCSASLCTCSDHCLADCEDDSHSQMACTGWTSCPCSHAPAQECRCAKGQIALTRARTIAKSRKLDLILSSMADLERDWRLSSLARATAINESTSLYSCDRCIEHCRLTI